MNDLMMYPFHLATNTGGFAIIMAADYNTALEQLLNQMPVGVSSAIFPYPYCMIEWHNSVKEQYETQQQIQQQTIKELRYA